MAKKNILKTDDDHLLRGLGIASSSRDYRLCHFLEKECGLPFSQTQELIVPSNKRHPSMYLSRFICQSTAYIARFQLISQKFQGECLLKELKTIDYLLVIEGEILTKEYSQIVNKVKSLSIVEYCTELSSEHIKFLTEALPGFLD